MKQFWVTFFGSVVGVVVGAVLVVFLVVMMIAGAIGAAIQGAGEGAPLPSDRVVVELDLRETRTDQPSNNPFAFGQPLPIVDVVRALERAETDRRVAGLFIRANEYGMSPGQAEELRAAIAALRASGRFVIVHAQGFESGSVSNYFAVSGADEIWLQDTATFSAAGLATETPFFGGLFERFEAEPEFLQFHEYKNAANIYTETGFTEAHLEATTSFLGSIFDSVADAVAADRGFAPDQARTLFMQAPHSAETALQARLVDRLGHVEAARTAARDRAGNGAQMVSIRAYHDSLGEQTRGDVIALIEGQGAIVTGYARGGAFGGEDMLGGDAMAEAIDAAARDDAVRAIVLRVDSPGGSAIASDQVWDAVRRAREAGKPVVVSMASLAASGGYYISVPADHIVAHATTLTGSIGVLGGKLYLHETFGLIGLNIEPLAVGGDFALAYSSQTRWTEAQREAVRAIMSDIYDDFTGRVAEGRNMPIERVREAARGRVWTGAQAAELGLVDEIGGLRTAVAAARRLANIDETAPVRLRRYPQPPSPFEALMRLFSGASETAESVARFNALMNLPEVRAAVEARQQADQPGVRMQMHEAEPR